MYHVLIVEDEPKIAAFMQKGLHQAGYSSAVAHDGYSALVEAMTGRFQLILLDLGLPGMDGQAVLQRLRSQGNTCPVIIVSARTLSSAETTSMQQLANGWVHKPFRIKDLLAQMQQRLPAQEYCTAS
ncbi:response regulator [Synechococcales cyanobacterium C]|uniref:Response regulator n=1 Tax=Petrachloros mirabilis ULC683 TaxID=2781853 RepID=A0A8K1ZZB5_9CYAN|nr:response regulator transcription factor [Petrachloros mirabilis]NCJ07593.1 response regulator [Petrachloros mirabilis ULC683]